MKILLVSDDRYLADVVSYTLKRSGHHVAATRVESDALRMFAEYQPDLILVDSPSKYNEGYDLCRMLRERTVAPMLYFGSCSDESVIIQAYESGIDDYIMKPFSNHHLMLRIVTAMRRGNTPQNLQGFDENKPITVGDIHIDPARHSATKNGADLSLTRIEFRLLHYLARNAGILLHFDRIADYVWQSPAGGDLTLLRTHVSRLRHKLTAANGSCVEIRAVQRTGYMLIVTPASRDGVPEPTRVARAG